MIELKTEDFEKKMSDLENEVANDVPVVEEITDKVVEEVKEEQKTETPKEEIKEELKEETKEKLDDEGNLIEKIVAYEPNTKFEFDPIFKPIITSKEIEDKVRILHAKAEGLEAVQHARDNWKGQFEEAKQEIDTIITPARMLYQRGQEFVEKGDIESAIQCIAGSMKSVYTEDEILAAANLIAETKLNPESKGRVERDLRFHQDSIVQKRERETIDNDRIAIESEQVSRELDFFFQQPEVTKVKDVYDSIHGDGAFFKKVGNYGHTMSLQTGKTYSVAKAIEDMLKEYSPLTNFVSNKPKETVSPQVKVQDRVVTPTDDGKIPNVRATASAGKKSSVSSIADLDSRIAQMEKEI
jgi:hypothetical protein